MFGVSTTSGPSFARLTRFNLNRSASRASPVTRRHREIAKTALGAQDHVRWSRPSDPLEYIETLRNLEFEVAAVETSSTAVDLFDWQPRFPVALLFGHEVNGLDGALLASCDTHVRLPMRGVKHSLNVATAGGVVLYELLRKYRRLCHRGGGSPDRL